ncbi:MULTISPECIES: TetR/AcrR family transcriptional regulator [Pontibacillus]|uniref:TetR/AcrR family transcriptional regulator n=1 Tax=Pontibacillus chungwhensis TaxID=265426 RepID=A0ABY8UWL0_9BACI|nr:MULTISPECIES: TetR/AcrR family transcriptional regulator [Pontibacillus]MCD5323425.1 TetR/AcrR family transcriptional regulator [Pontibacillus sp. HN14]WIF96805.1 TetR/AcrR family transcriptional regulator [Pontibacillus chungwhensis]
MDQKKVNIIENAITLFAQKGFSSTSVQEIVKASQISKGAFYLHFNSKDELLHELFEYYWRRMQTRINEVSSKPLDPKEKFTDQLKVTIEEIATHRDFIIMQVREQAIPFNETIEHFIRRMRYHSILFYRNHLLGIYGQGIEPYVWEASVMVQGLLKSYMDLIIVDNVEFDYYLLAQSITNRVDSLIEGYANKNDPPVITENVIQQLTPSTYNMHNLDDLLEQLELIALSDPEPAIKETIDVLIQELKSPSPRKVIITGMAHHLEKYERYTDLASLLRAYFM